MVDGVLTRERFRKYIRDGLNHLHDLDFLRQSPLVSLLCTADQFDGPTCLQHVLIEAIESLEPGINEPSRSSSWHIYEPLFFRYVQGLRQWEVAEQMNISPRHVRRKQSAALDVLTCRLWEQYDLDSKSQEHENRVDFSSEDAELAWLRNLPECTTNLNRTLPAILELMRPMAAEHRIHLEISPNGHLPNLAVHSVALRQILLNLLSVLIPRLQDGTVFIDVRSLWQDVEIRVEHPVSSASPRSHSPDDETNLAMAHRLSSLCGGKLIVSEDDDRCSIILAFPGIELLKVMVIDDNLDSLQLLHRFAAGTPYHLIVLQDPRQALDMAKELSPQVIVLDVMMPQVDGWEIMGQLRHHPQTEHIPILVYTILAQEKLAFSLGAKGFIQKPITKQGLLDALDRLIEILAKESR